MNSLEKVEKAVKDRIAAIETLAPLPVHQLPPVEKLPARVFIINGDDTAGRARQLGE